MACKITWSFAAAAFVFYYLSDLSTLLQNSISQYLYNYIMVFTSKQKKERKILVAIDYEGYMEVNEVIEIIKKYIHLDNYDTHYIDEGKTYVNLKDMDDATWDDFTSKWCDDCDSIRTPSGFVLKKYDDWRLCALPVDWD